MSFRCTQDNVLIRLEPLETETASGLSIVQLDNGAHGHRKATVIDSGPGYYGPPTFLHPEGLFHPNEVKAGDRVIVSKYAGHDYSLDLNVPRHNKSIEFQKLLGDRGNFRIVRHDEILAVIEPEAVAAE